MSIHGQILEVTVVGCSRLRDTEWISRQDPYVCLEYASTKHRTRTCTDGGKNPTFQEKFVFNLIEGLREINVSVWNSNSLTYDDLIGSGKILLNKVLSQGYDDMAWTIQSKRGRYAGEVTVIMHFLNAQKPSSAWTSSAPPYTGVPAPAGHYPASYPPPPPAPARYPPPAGYPSYPPASSSYPSYPPAAPPAYPPTYPPQQQYPPPAGVYPPPPYPPGPYSTYPPPPY
ncbi:unnamed protein product [Spirodela intermedia]|uniref:C2 domain-containing protein n=1 Tax=Spirodela intermedia TaxID=51605 RepID=A0A7I8LCT6_SPIIN|nr:unnamed protein product [Spirodela intermedia]